MTFTQVILIAVLVAGIGIDIYLALNKTRGDTWSETIASWAFGKWSSLPFILGYLSGHFFISVNYWMPFWITALILGMSILILQVLRAFWEFPKWSIPVIFLIGYFAGGFTFPMP